MISRVGIVVSLVLASGWMPAATAVRAQETSPFFAGFEGSWAVTAEVGVGADSAVKRTLTATVRSVSMAPVRAFEIVLTGPLPAALAKTCPEASGVPLPCETRFFLACHCERGEGWFQRPFLRSGSSLPDSAGGGAAIGEPDPTGSRLVLKRTVDGRVISLNVWTKRNDGFVLQHMEIGPNGEQRPVATLTFGGTGATDRDPR